MNTVNRLFIGGPYDGRMLALRADHDRFYVDHMDEAGGISKIVYIKRVFHSPARGDVDVMVEESMSLQAAQDRISNAILPEMIR